MDCIVGHVVMWARQHGLCTGAPFDRYPATVAARPAYAKAFSDAHRFVPAVSRDAPVVEMFTG